ncbi:class I SAM-dependent methyltransferase [Chamaesiphon sp. OTE_8_metabat_110]|uniref:class I SAM-dependent methyltransferase n=1 Tax=Chamaesiphon sp. OTE_8_metabat_110 TaxID=2964696 RepID=UPI002869F177|nr:class I SAM-dependent methyltransferase [Chamaesiphon sp. OTE_8_metabat_110]
MDSKTHWETVYQAKAANEVSWYRAHLDKSLALIERAAPDLNAAIIDIGGGEATLVDDLIERGYQHLNVLDISQAAIDTTRQRLGTVAERINWIVADIVTADLPSQQYDVWHDRAVFHFLTLPAQRVAYVRQVLDAVNPGGHVIIATFGLDGPEKCSGLEIVRYDAGSLQAEFGDRFQLLEASMELHKTPFDTTQQFLYCHFLITIT